MKSPITLALFLLIACVGCGRPEHNVVHRRLEGEWITADGRTRYVFERGTYKMVESSDTSNLAYRIQEVSGDDVHIRVTLLHTGGGHDKYLHFSDDGQMIEEKAELDGIRVTGVWRRVAGAGGEEERR